MHYLVIVRSQGNIIATHPVEAPNALAAIAETERLYGAPVRVEYVSVELDDGRKQTKMIIHNWHGYSFLARKIEADEKL